MRIGVLKNICNVTIKLPIALRSSKALYRLVIFASLHDAYRKRIFEWNFGLPSMTKNVDEGLIVCTLVYNANYNYNAMENKSGKY